MEAVVCQIDMLTILARFGPRGTSSRLPESLMASPGRPAPGIGAHPLLTRVGSVAVAHRKTHVVDYSIPRLGGFLNIG